MADKPSVVNLAKQTFSERAARLKRFTELSVPPWIICAEVMLVFKGAFAVYPEEMAQAYGSWVTKVAKGEIAICSDCGEYLPHEMHACEKCIMAGAEKDETF